MKRDRDRWLRLWLLFLNLAVAGIGAAWAALGYRRAFFLVLFVPLALGPFSWSRLRVHRALRRSLPRRRWARRFLPAVGVAGIACDLLMVAQLMTARSESPVPFLQADGVNWIGAVWFSAHALDLLGAGIASLVRGIGRGTRRLRRSRTVGDAPPASAERRLFLQQMGAVGVAAPFAISLSGVPLSYDFRVDERDVHLPNWPRELDGLRVVHLSDIHVGGDMNRERLLRVAELTNEAKPDVVIHTGDFLTHRSGNFDLPLYEALAKVRAPRGQWACLGNHDYEDAPTLVRRLGDAGVVTLRNQRATLDLGGAKLEIGGLDFVGPGGRVEAYENAMRGWRERGGPRLLLNHDPSGFSSLPAGCADLVCSGHTHGGHIGIQLGLDQAFTVIGLVGLPDQGLFERDDMRMFVTRCVGFYGYPMRIGIPPEIAVLVLRSA